MSSETAPNKAKNARGLRRGWTTGACATAATKAALTALLTGNFPDPVTITLPKGQTPSFALAHQAVENDRTMAAIIKDAGDDPDVTHGATIISRVRKGPSDTGIVFCAGTGVGTVTLAGLPVPQGQPAINPVPRKMMVEVVESLCSQHGINPDIEIEISIPDGEALAVQTWNPRLGIIGGLSILGTTGIVNPFSCAAWIHSIHRGIDVARAAGLTHVLGSTGSTSEATGQKLYSLPDIACLDMGDFAGGLLKYLRAHPVARLTIAGGFAKLTKLAQGAMDLHSGRSQVDFDWLAERAHELGASEELTLKIAAANTALETFTLARGASIDLPSLVAEHARKQATILLRGDEVSVDILVTDREGNILARSGNTDD